MAGEGEMTWLVDMKGKSRENEGMDPRGRYGAEMSTLLLLWVEVKHH